MRAQNCVVVRVDHDNNDCHAAVVECDDRPALARERATMDYAESLAAPDEGATLEFFRVYDCDDPAIAILRWRDMSWDKLAERVR